MTTDKPLDEMDTEELYEALGDAVDEANRPRIEGWITGKQIEETRLMATDEDSSSNVSFRISDALLERIEAARSDLDAAATASGKVSRSEAMRRLILRGLETLDTDNGSDTDG